MKLPNEAHTTHAWRIHEVARDFEVEDVWALPTPGNRDDFPLLVECLSAFDPSQSESLIVRLLFEARSRLGGVLGWDRPETGLGTRVATLRDGLPADLLDARPGPQVGTGLFVPLYQLDDEFAAEIANKTMHGIVHLGWVPNESGGYRGQLAILVKRNGLIGAAYMAGIAPFRHLLVYPTLMRDIGRAWNEAKALELRPRSVPSLAAQPPTPSR